MATATPTKAKDRPKAPKKKNGGAPSTEHLVGEPATIRALADFTKNDWNSNEFTVEERRALREGLKADRWLVSQAMTVWGTDEKGRRQNVIIDGEHRWEEAIRLGIKTGPVVVLDGITRAEAVAWTYRLANVRGHLDEKKTARTLDRELGLFNGKPDRLDLGIRLGFGPERLEGLKLKLADRRAPTGEKKPAGAKPHLEHTCPNCGHKW